MQWWNNCLYFVYVTVNHVLKFFPFIVIKNLMPKLYGPLSFHFFPFLYYFTAVKTFLWQHIHIYIYIYVKWTHCKFRPLRPPTQYYNRTFSECCNWFYMRKVSFRDHFSYNASFTGPIVAVITENIIVQRKGAALRNQSIMP